MIEKVKKAIQNPRRAYQYLRSQDARQPIEKLVTNVKGKYLFDYEWDCAIILDACRYDLAAENQFSFDFLGQPEPVYSVGSNSKVWLTRTFGKASSAQLSNTRYITGNIFSSEAVPEEVECEEIWRTGFDETMSTVPPETITDQAIIAGRKHDLDRLIVHYMQPHLPSLALDRKDSADLDFRGGWGENNPWRRIEQGDLEPEAVVRAYRRNLEPVLHEVKELLQNLDAEEVIVTADHGNYLGESGRWGHHNSVGMSKAVRQVPWWETRGIDTKKRIPDDNTMEDSLSRDEKLEALGYI